MDFVEILKVVVLGIIEGVTEWLPISSTGHMILADEFIKLSITPEFKEMFLVVIQLGAILAVVLLYFRKLNPFALSKTPAERRDTVILWLKVLVAILPAAIIGIPFNDEIDKLFYNYQTVTVTLIVYGVLFILLENRNRGRKPLVKDFSQLTYKTAALIGVFQVLALIPGTSRSGATILGAILLGTSRYVAAEFSFFLSIPVMFGASAIKLLKFGFHFTNDEWVILLTGMVVAFAVSVLAIKFLMGYIKKHDFKVFGWYRIVLGIVVAIYFMFFAK
ncbi:undecaprenyl-diphosphate phosphatase [Hydrogenoanaerobacterium sp.]|uniref:undecaprenyl-diphosphate phosphatase n=1 Tax=Hydrogenoanaerobacterium sp. TaxID=2953763 RepID=UPI00289CAAEC|nr:undecaprenyl-diphosphate phosphatase [Hydrogenoanaerobacterium sp.]